MRANPPGATDETRADVARRRLAQLAASFDAELPPAVVPEPARRRIEIPHLKVLATIAVAGSVLLVWWLLSGRPQTSEPVAPLAFPSSAATPGAVAPEADGGTKGPGTAGEGETLVIDVIGKVRKPGIVTVPVGSRVFEAIEEAGGLKGTPDTTALNMARVLGDGEQILVGMKPAAVPGTPSGAAGGAPGAAPAAAINLNSATLEQLDTLPGIGPVTAAAILDWRTENGRFGSVDDLLDVKGIGDATLADLRDLVTV